MTVRNNVQSVIAAILEGVRDGLTEIGQASVGYARGIVPVDTGALRDSIDFDVDGDAVAVYADTPYAAYVELGTSMHAPQPYLGPSVTEHTREHMATLGNAIGRKIS